MWAPANGAKLPTLNDWIDAIELLFGVPSQAESGQLFNAYELQDGTLDSLQLFGRATIPEILQRYPWLIECRRINDLQAYFHWELEFAPVLARGGFEVQVGNPPWVRLDWDEPASLAEHDPWWGVVNLKETSTKEKRVRREKTLQISSAADTYMADRSENEGLCAHLAAVVLEPTLSGLRTNLYMNFMTSSWRRCQKSGVVGLVHPESHFVDPKAGSLRGAAYRRLRRHWQFANELFLFEEVDHHTEFGIHVYSSSRLPEFRQAVSLFTPATLDRSLEHDGSGPTPAIQHLEGGWDLRPHISRIVHVDTAVLSEWVTLFDEPGTPPERSRLLRPLTVSDLDSLSVFARQTRRISDENRFWTSGFNEKTQKEDGTFEWRTGVPLSLNDCILQGPHIVNGTPFAQQPRENCKNNNDWEPLDLEVLPIDFVPRANYQRLVSPKEFLNRQTSWGGSPYTTHYREAHREFVGSGAIRTLQSVLLPCDLPHLYTLNSIALETPRKTAYLAGLFSSLPYDYLVKVFGVSHLTQSVTDVICIPDADPILMSLLIHRALRLNCLTSAYDGLWTELFDPAWASDKFVAGTGTVDLRSESPTWSAATPLRTDLDRWLASCEIDALVARILDLTEDQLLQMYRSQFFVLRKYEFLTVFDVNGRQISADFHNHGFLQTKWESESKAKKVGRGEKRVGMWNRVQAYLGGDTSVDLGPFEPPFIPADRELAMSKAYRAFAEMVPAP